MENKIMKNKIMENKISYKTKNKTLT